MHNEHLIAPGTSSFSARDERHREAQRRNRRSFFYFAVLLFLLHTICMLYRYGHRPPAPVIGDEVTINDPAVALSRGQGLIAPSFHDSVFGLDRLYAHFPPVYAFIEAVPLRLFGVSVYTLRLTTTTADLAAVGVLLFSLYWLCSRGLAQWRMARFAALMYGLNASMVVLHRTARMEPIIEFLSMVSLLCILSGLHSPADEPQEDDARYSPPSRRRQQALLSLGALCGGLALATHPEALNALLPAVLLLLSARALTKRTKLLLLCLLAITPALIWFSTYGRNSLRAAQQMAGILVLNTPRPGILRFAHEFTLAKNRNPGSGMRATLFVLCLTVLAGNILRWAQLERRARSAHFPGTRPGAAELHFARTFALSAALTLFTLSWVVGASITRYEVIFPVYLETLVIMLSGIWAEGPTARIASAAVISLTGAQVLAIGLYLSADRDRLDAEPNRFDAVVAAVPPQGDVAITPMLWLDFVQKHRPVTLLYLHFDGLPAWFAVSRNPLDQFDAVVLDESFVDEFRFYAPYAAQGRQEHRIVVGSDVVHIYTKPSLQNRQ